MKRNYFRVSIPKGTMSCNYSILITYLRIHPLMIDYTLPNTLQCLGGGGGGEIIVPVICLTDSHYTQQSIEGVACQPRLSWFD